MDKENKKQYNKEYNQNRRKTAHDGNNEALKLLIINEKACSLLRRIRKVTNEILINTAYHNVNKEIQLNKIQRANAPKDEIQMIKDLYDLHEEIGTEAKERHKEMIKLLKGE